MNKDLQHLKILSIFYYVVGGLLAVFGCFPLIYLFMGVALLVAPPPSAGVEPPPASLAWFFITFSGGATLLVWLWAGCLLVAGWFLSQRKHRIYCLVMGCITCLFNPFGTILGVFSIILLIRPSIKRLFEIGEQPYDPEADDWSLRSSDHIMGNPYNIGDER